MFIRQKLSEEQKKRAEEIESKAHELALLIQKNTNGVTKTMEQAIMRAKEAAMIARVAIATEDREDY